MSNLVPDGWGNKSLSDSVTLAYGKSPKDIFIDDGIYPVIGTGGITGYTNSFLHEGCTTVVGRKGSINNPSFIDKRFWAIDTTYYVSNYKGTDAKWFFYLLQSMDLKKYNEASGVPSLNRDTLYSISFMAPPLPEQKKIAAILTSVDDVIEKTQAQIDKLKDLKTGMMQELLTRGVGVDGKPHSEFKDSPVGWIPKGWEVVTLGDITEESVFGPRFSSSEYAIDGNIGCIRTTDMDENWDINYSTAPRAKLNHQEFEKHFLRDGDLLVTRSGTCGLVDVFKEQSLPMVAAAFLIRFRLITSVNPYFVRYLMMSSSIQENVQLLASGGVQKNLSGTSLKTLKLPMPSVEEQNQVVNAIESINRSIASVQRKQFANKVLKKALMQDLLTGKVRVKVEG